MKTITFERLMLGLLFGALGAVACLMPAQSDTFWHLRAGAEIWNTLRVPLDEHYSFTAAGRFWPNHEWLWQLVSFGLVRAGGFPLLTAVSAAIVIGAIAIVYDLMVGPPRERFVLLLLGVPLAGCVWALRPQIVSLLFLALLVRLLARKRFGWLPGLFVVWANVHGAVALGGAVLCAVAATALLRARAGDRSDRRRAGALLVLVPACALATALTPMGFGLWTYIGTSMALSRATRIDEWQPAYPTGPVEIGFLLLAAAFIGLLVWRWRRLARAGWSDIACVAAALVVLPLALRAVRNIPPFLLLALPAASRLLGPEFRFARVRGRAAGTPTPDAATGLAMSPRATDGPGDHPRLNAILLGAVTLAEIAIVAVAWRTPDPRLGWQPLSTGAIEAARACPGPLYNRYYDGGYLIWFSPDRPVFVDSRQDPYPLPLLLEQEALEAGGPYRPVFDRYGITCALLPAGAPLAARLRADGWRPRFDDVRWSVLYAPGPS
jgi:hypothetical protein